MGGRGTSEPDGSLQERVRAHLDTTGLIPRGRPLVVAVSGGGDSMALLHLLRFPLRDRGHDLRAAHVDHAMRPGSRADADWVRGVCRAWDIPLHEVRLDPPARSEADARARRYAFLRAVAPRALLLTAHHRDDQAETVLFRAARGTGLRGIRGIAPRRGRLVRPLLPFRRAELEAYAAGAALRHREDPTNRDEGYARNRIRLRILPELERIRPGATEALARLADRARVVEAALQAALRRLEEEAVTARDASSIVLARPVLASYDPALQARLLHRLLHGLGSTPERAGTRAALEFISSGPSGGEIHVRGGVRIERDFDRIRVSRLPREPSEEPSDEALEIPGPGPGAGRARIGGRWVRVEWGKGAARVGAGAAWTGPDFPLTVRGWRPGDRIRFAYGSKKMKKLFAERRLDRRARRRVPLVVDGEGRVLWAVGIARADGVTERGADFEIMVSDAE